MIQNKLIGSVTRMTQVAFFSLTVSRWYLGSGKAISGSCITGLTILGGTGFLSDSLKA